MTQFIYFVLLGLVAGALARLLVPGRDPMGCIGTILLGVTGSVVGGYLYMLIWGGGQDFQPARLIGSIIGAVIVLLIWRAVTGRRRRT